MDRVSRYPSHHCPVTAQSNIQMISQAVKWSTLSVWAYAQAVNFVSILWG